MDGYLGSDDDANEVKFVQVRESNCLSGGPKQVESMRKAIQAISKMMTKMIKILSDLSMLFE